MKFASLLAILILSASCGKDGGGGSSISKRPGVCELNGRSVACETIQGADGFGIDLLESMIDVPVQITDSDIRFMENREAHAQGRRIDCSTTVKSGEVYRYSVHGDTLVLSTDSGSYDMQRLNSGQGLSGTWMWKGYINQGTHIIRQFSFLGNNRVIIRTNCEL